MRAELEKLNPRHRMFVEAYCGDPVEAMKLAGYQGTDQALKYKGNELLKQPLILEAIKHRGLYQNKMQSVVANREERQAFWTEIMMNKDANARPEIDKFGNPLPEHVVPNIPLKDRLKASELLGKSEGDFIDRVQIDANITLNDIIMKSYSKEDPEDLSLEDIEAEYYRMQEESEADEEPKELPPPTGYSFI